MNIVLIETDQQRRDSLGCYGNNVVRTPNIDGLAREGVTFECCSPANPICMPSRASMITGRWPRNHGVWCNGIRLDPRQPTLAGHLAEHGCETIGVGKFHYEPHGGSADYKESRAAWSAHPGLAGWHGPFYGFGDVEIAGGHGPANTMYGHYANWLRERISEAEIERLAREFDAAKWRPPQRKASTFPAELHHSSWVGETASAKIRECAKKDRPFFLFASFPDPHHPFTPPEPHASMYDRADVVMPLRREGELDDKPPHFADRFHGRGERFEGAREGLDFSALTEDDVRDVIALTYGMVTLIDENVGKILAALDEAGIADETAVVFTSDHGDLLGDHGLIFKGPIHYDGLITVPYVWRIPGVEGGRRIASPASQVDFPDTVCDLLGLPRMESSEGRSMKAVLTGEAESYRDATIVEFQSQYRRHLKLKTIRTPEWKLTFYGERPYGELYDLVNDPDEFVNLYEDPRCREMRIMLQDRLMNMLVDTGSSSPGPECHA